MRFAWMLGLAKKWLRFAGQVSCKWGWCPSCFPRTGESNLNKAQNFLIFPGPEMSGYKEMGVLVEGSFSVWLQLKPKAMLKK